MSVPSGKKGFTAPDQLDRAILRLLHEDGRMSYSEIGRRTDCSEVTARKRVEKLIAQGTLAVAGISNPVHLGFNCLVWIGLRVELARLDAVAEELAKMPEFTYVACYSGEYDVIGTAAFESNAALYAFLTKKLGKVEGIQRTHVSHVMKRVRRTFAYRSVQTSSEVADDQPLPILTSGIPFFDEDLIDRALFESNTGTLDQG